MIRKYGILMILTFLLVSCEEVIEWKLPDEIHSFPVIEAILSDEIKQHEISITSVTDEINGIISGLSGAEVFVHSNGSSLHFTEDQLQKGRYIADEEAGINLNQKYRLEVMINGELYLADARAVAAFPMRNFSFQPFENTDSLVLAGLGVDYSEHEQSMYEFLVDWSHISGDENSKAKLFHFVFNSLNIGQLFGPAREVVAFPKGSQVIISRYSLEDQFAEYLRALVIETTWKGGFFEESSGNLPTNLSGGALGFFAACQVNRDTVIAQ